MERENISGICFTVKSVPADGFEPSTFGSGDQRSNPLSYAGKRQVLSRGIAKLHYSFLIAKKSIIFAPITDETS